MLLQEGLHTTRLASQSPTIGFWWWEELNADAKRTKHLARNLGRPLKPTKASFAQIIYLHQNTELLSLGSHFLQRLHLLIHHTWSPGAWRYRVSITLQ